jgi:hypothetical protein
MRILKSSRFQAALSEPNSLLQGKIQQNFAGLRYIFGPVRTRSTLRSRGVSAAVLRQAGRYGPKRHLVRRNKMSDRLGGLQYDDELC